MRTEQLQHFPEPVELWLWLSSTAWGGIAAIAAVCGMLIAGGAAVLVLRQLQQARDLAEEQARPYVVPMLEPSLADMGLYDFVVKNIGQTAARDLTMAIDPPYIRAKAVGVGAEFMDANFINNKTSVLAPGAEIRTYFDSTRDVHQAKGAGRGDVARPFTLKLSYRDRLGREIVESFDLDFSEKMGTLRTEVHGLHHIAKSLRAMAKKQGATSF